MAVARHAQRLDVAGPHRRAAHARPDRARELTEREPVDLAHSVLGRYEGVAAELSPARAAGDPVLLERVIANLADNAVTYKLRRRLCERTHWLAA
ncbi:hypothetical protein ACTWPT_29615 [Nonomuraea sp. 3N208]|uniref:hypothetical protein n=1 Tax=Nonomuraea sp. 3N208 TaxID=3457421 RepID=UPI003FD53A9D